MPTADLAQGTAVTFGTSGFTALLDNLSWGGISREARDTSHLGTSTWRTFIPGDLTDAGEITMAILFDPDDFPPINSAAETVTVTFPTPLGGSTPADWEATGFATGFEFDAPEDDLMTGTLTVKVTGAITPTAST